MHPRALLQPGRGMTQCHVAWKCIGCVLLALHEFAGHLQHVIHLILSDKTTMVSYLSKQGGTHSALVCGLAWQTFQLAQSLDLEI